VSNPLFKALLVFLCLSGVFLGNKQVSRCKTIFGDSSSVITVYMRQMQGSGLHTKLDKLIRTYMFLWLLYWHTFYMYFYGSRRTGSTYRISEVMTVFWSPPLMCREPKPEVFVVRSILVLGKSKFCCFSDLNSYWINLRA